MAGMWRTYDGLVPSPSRPAPEDLLPGGIFSLRRSVRRRGGVAALLVALALFILGVIVSGLTGGVIGSAVAFMLQVMAVPAMPVVGMPVAGGSVRFLVAAGLSAAAWFVIGHMAGARVAKRPVVGWREWTREFVSVGLGLWIGALGALGLAAIALGAF